MTVFDCIRVSNMKYTWIRLCQWLLGVLGISAVINSCESLMTVEYGQPNMNYSVKGKVVDAKSGAGVAGIEVCHIPHGSQVDTTGTDGSFEISGNTFPAEKLEVYLKDIDPADNGNYKSTGTTVQLKQVEEGKGHWFKGTFEASDAILKVEEDNQ